MGGKGHLHHKFFLQKDSMAFMAWLCLMENLFSIPTNCLYGQPYSNNCNKGLGIRENGFRSCMSKYAHLFVMVGVKFTSSMNVFPEIERVRSCIRYFFFSSFLAFTALRHKYDMKIIIMLVKIRTHFISHEIIEYQNQTHLN